MTTTQPTLETWEQKARRLAEELASLRSERDGLDIGPRWTKLCRAIRSKRYEIECHLAAVA